MSSRTKVAVVAAMFVFTITTAQAAVECPTTSQGRALAQWGGTLYQGDPSNDVSLAPSQSNPGNRGINLWKTPDPVGINLVCRYVGGRSLMLPLTTDVRMCLQNPASFICK